MIFFLNCVAVWFCLEPRCLGGLTNKLLKCGFLGLYLSVNTPMGVPLLLAQALFAERSVSKVTNIPINDHLSHHDEKHHDNHKLSSFTISILTIIITIASPGTSAARKTLSIKVHHYQQDHISSRLEICRDRRDRRSCKIFPSCVKFWGNNANSLGNYRVYYALNE